MRNAVLIAAVALATVARAEYTEAAVTNGGTISGRVTYDGTPPKPEKVTVTQDPGPAGPRASSTSGRSPRPVG